MNNPSITFRRVEYSDLTMILKWRNHPSVRLQKLNTHIITQEEHVAWFKSEVLTRKVNSLIAESNNQPVGVINIKSLPKDTFAEWGIYLKPDLIGLGFGPFLALNGLSFVFQNTTFDHLFAFIKESNRSSMKLHQYFGFTACSKPDWLIDSRLSIPGVSLLMLNQTDCSERENYIKSLLSR